MAVTREVGILLAASPGDWASYIAKFKQRVTTPGVRFTELPPGGANGDQGLLDTTAAYLSQICEVVVTASTQGALALQEATKVSQKSFVFASVGDPTISGLLPQPGGHYTGCSNQQVKLVTQRVDEMLANGFVGPFAVVGNYAREPIKTAMTTAVSTLIARGQTAQLEPINAQTNIGTFISGLKSQGIKSLYVCSDLLITNRSSLLNAKAHSGPVGSRQKTMFEFGEHVTRHGGNLSYGIKFEDLFDKAAEYVDLILGGTSPGDLPIFEPPPADRELKKKDSKAKDSKPSVAKKRPVAPKKKKSRRGR